MIERHSRLVFGGVPTTAGAEGSAGDEEFPFDGAQTCRRASKRRRRPRPEPIYRFSVTRIQEYCSVPFFLPLRSRPRPPLPASSDQKQYLRYRRRGGFLFCAGSPARRSSIRSAFYYCPRAHGNARNALLTLVRRVRRINGRPKPLRVPSRSAAPIR